MQRNACAQTSGIHRTTKYANYGPTVSVYCFRVTDKIVQVDISADFKNVLILLDFHIKKMTTMGSITRSIMCISLMQWPLTHCCSIRIYQLSFGQVNLSTLHGVLKFSRETIISSYTWNRFLMARDWTLTKMLEWRLKCYFLHKCQHSARKGYNDPWGVTTNVSTNVENVLKSQQRYKESCQK